MVLTSPIAWSNNWHSVNNFGWPLADLRGFVHETVALTSSGEDYDNTSDA